MSNNSTCADVNQESKTEISENLKRYALKDSFGIDEEKIIIKRDQFGKPYLYGFENVHFNVSHSGRFYICACSSNKVGIDIENRLRKRYGNTLMNLHPYEKNYVLTSKNPQESFLKIWVRKEALFKASGTGILNELNSFSVISDDNQLSEMIEYKHENYYFSDPEISMDSYSCLCTSHSNIEFNVININKTFLCDMKGNNLT